MRLDKFLSHATELTRTLAKQAIRQQRVRINNQIARSAAQIILDTDLITLDAEKLVLPENRYIMLHKPAGYVCTRDDAHHASVFSLVSDSDELHVAGRLDADTTGLVLLTSNGQWSHRVTSPRHKCNKVYCVTLAQALSREQAAQIEQGVILHGENRPTLPAQLQGISDTQLRLTLHEGKYHQVKRMFAATGNEVIRLHRESIGHVILDNNLQPGEWRNLTAAEYEAF
ncbi:MAG: rRNA pseudouridine516 synthase [Pseudomonadota bacterium]|nr:rRNA pseudouridine516 synthase [Pseudomonadota bacterium]